MAELLPKSPGPSTAKATKLIQRDAKSGLKDHDGPDSSSTPSDLDAMANVLLPTVGLTVRDLTTRLLLSCRPKPSVAALWLGTALGTNAPLVWQSARSSTDRILSECLIVLNYTYGCYLESIIGPEE